MGKARNLSDLASSIGDLAYLDAVAAANVSGLGTLATKSIVGTTDLDDLAVTGAKIANDTVTSAKLGANEQRQIVRAFGYVNGSTGALVAGFGLTAARSATGTYTVTLDSAAPNTDYTVVAMARQTSNLDVAEESSIARTTTVIPLKGRNTSTSTAADVPFYSVMVMW